MESRVKMKSLSCEACVASYALVPKLSRVWAEARSSLHPIHLETAGLVGQLEAEVTGADVRLALPMHVELAVELLRTNNPLLDSELQRRLESKHYPRIVCEVHEVKTGAVAGRLRLRGELSLHGKAQTLEVEVTTRSLDAHTLEVEGAKTIDMRDFGLTPPRFLFLSVQPEVAVRALLVAKRQT